VRLVGDARSVALTCREDESESAYIFAVSPGAGTFAVLRMDNGTQVDLVTQRTGSFRAGGAANRVELTCAGDSITGSVNGTQVTSVRDSVHPGEGSMTLILLGRGAGEARFDNLVVTRR